eukprot:TRINITY_DN79442_c0_g1_i1.p1 TRINITY_DN79442_c0_g1~~TRINITY_DN79442_c0_g1_i1.p1  ORF type:complete len:176 (+),score=11.02 TRINITY_DN79442_c0_g1_i1:35-529(+)
MLSSQYEGPSTFSGGYLGQHYKWKSWPHYGVSTTVGEKEISRKDTGESSNSTSSLSGAIYGLGFPYYADYSDSSVPDRPGAPPARKKKSSSDPSTSKKKKDKPLKDSSHQHNNNAQVSSPRGSSSIAYGDPCTFTFHHLEDKDGRHLRSRVISAMGTGDRVFSL